MLKTGLQPRVVDARIPALRSIMTNPPTASDEPGTYFQKVSFWPTLGNDKISNCSIASALHQVQLWTAANGAIQIPDEPCAIANYAHATGYDPATGANDNGAILSEIVKYWMSTGLAIYENGSLNVLDAVAYIDPHDRFAMFRGLASFGSLYTGIGLPLTAQTEYLANVPWEQTTQAPRTWGGHAVPIVYADANWLYVITWGKVQKMSWGFWLKYAEDCFAPLRRDWLSPKGLSPTGMTEEQLDGQIKALRGLIGSGA